TTKVPWPGLVSTKSRVSSHLIASRMVLRDAPNSFCSSPSVGKGPFGSLGSSPDSILRRRSSAIVRYSGSATGPPRRTNQPDERPHQSQVDHSRDPSHPNIQNESCFTVPWWGTIEIRTEGWDEWNSLIHADDTSSSSDRMHQDPPTNSQHRSGRYQPDRADHPDRDLWKGTPQVSTLGGPRCPPPTPSSSSQ